MLDDIRGRALNGLGGFIILPNPIKLRILIYSFTADTPWVLISVVERETAQIAV